MSNMELVNPELIKAPLPYNNDIPSPVFDTWGGPTQQQIIDSAPVGTTIHLAPIGFFGNSTVEQRVGYAMNAVEWVDNVGITPGIHFFNYPEDWMYDHLDMMVKNQNGEYIVGDNIFTFTSPWNPDARALWQQHITYCLDYMQTNNRLQYVKVVEVSTGYEGEISYEWSSIWAFDDYAIGAYRQYLRTLYDDDIANLNADWGSSHTNFDSLMPPGEWYPDRAHWVFTDFYRLSMLEYYIFLADAVRQVFTPDYWLAMVHTLPSYPMRFYSARYALFYAENMARLGTLDYSQIAALDWQHEEDVDYLQSVGLKVIGEQNILHTEESLAYTFSQAEKYGMNGVFVGVIELLSSGGQLTSLGQLAQQLIQDFSPPNPPPGDEVIIEDFEDVSDWFVSVGMNAVSGSITTDAGQAQEGSYAGALNYEHSTAQGFDYVFYTLNLSSSPLDFSDPDLILKLELKMSYDPDRFLQIRLSDTTGAFIERNFGEGGDGLWHTMSLAVPEDFADFGTDPDLSAITSIRFETNGDGSTNYTSGTIYVDKLVFVTSN